MDRVEWLDRALRVLSKHYASSLIVHFDHAVGICEIHDDEWARLFCEGTTLADAVEHGIRQLTDEQLLAAEHKLTDDQHLAPEVETRRRLVTTAVMARMGHPEAAPEEQVTLQLNGFAQKVHVLVEEADDLKTECAGVCIGYGLGALMALGATEAQLRERCEEIIQGLVDGAAAIVAHEKKTFS